MTDLVAFRIITYLESEIKLIEAALRSYFHVDEKKSVDKRIGTNPNEVGYRSLHLICKLGQSRATLPEHSGCHGIPFEIQVRTVLEHAWAEIEHKQNYKSAVALPANLQRKLNIISGTLELVDSQLAAIADEAVLYSKKVAENSDEVQEDLISGTSLYALGHSYAASVDLRLDDHRSEDNYSDLIIELEKFGIQTVVELSQLLVEQSDKILSNNPHGTTLFGLVRDALIFKDYKKYFYKCYSHQFRFGRNDVNRMSEILGGSDLLDYMEENGVDLFDDRDELFG